MGWPKIVMTAAYPILICPFSSTASSCWFHVFFVTPPKKNAAVPIMKAGQKPMKSHVVTGGALSVETMYRTSSTPQLAKSNRPTTRESMSPAVIETIERIFHTLLLFFVPVGSASGRISVNSASMIGGGGGGGRRPPFPEVGTSIVGSLLLVAIVKPSWLC